MKRATPTPSATSQARLERLVPEVRDRPGEEEHAERDARSDAQLLERRAPRQRLFAEPSHAEIVADGATASRCRAGRPGPPARSSPTVQAAITAQPVALQPVAADPDVAGLDEPVGRQGTADVAHEAVAEREPDAAEEREQRRRAADHGAERVDRQQVAERDAERRERQQAEQQQRGHLDPLARRHAHAERDPGRVEHHERQQREHVGGHELGRRCRRSAAAA